MFTSDTTALMAKSLLSGVDSHDFLPVEQVRLRDAECNGQECGQDADERARELGARSGEAPYHTAAGGGR